MICFPIISSFVCLWSAYFLIKKGTPSNLTTKKTQIKLHLRTLARTERPVVILAWGRGLSLGFFLYWFLIRGFEGNYLLNHAHLSNNIFLSFYWISGLTLCTWLWLTWYSKGLATSGLVLDYFFSALQLLMYLPFIFLSNTLLTVFFLVELTSSIILYNFVTMQSLFYSFNKKKVKASVADLHYFFNLIFFQFWASFFSSIILLYSILNFHFLYGTTEYNYLNFFIAISNTNSTILLLASVLLLVGFFLKLGIAPMFAYKLELYRGLPLFNLVFYSLIYFFIYVTLFFILFAYYFTALLFIIRPIVLIILCGIITLFGFFLFDTAIMRHFFALSSLINSTNLVFILFA